MNPFRAQAADPVTEADLIAFHLRDLSPRRERAVRRALKRSPALAAEAVAVAASLSALKDLPMHIDHAVLDRNWNAIRPSLTPYALAPLRAPRWRLPVFAGAVAATVGTVALLVSTRHAVPRAQPEVPPLPQLASTQTPGPEGLLPLSRKPAQPLFHLSPEAGVFHSVPLRPESAVHLIAPAELTPSAPPPHRLTAQPEPPAPPALLVYTPPLGPAVSAADPLPTPLTSHPSGRAHPRTIEPLRDRRTTDLMLAVGGNFIAPHSSQSAGVPRSQTATHALSAVGAFHQQFRPMVGYRVTASYSRPEFDYSYGGSGGQINSRIYEAAGTYVLQGTRHHRLTPSADAGAGLLAFLPTVASSSTSYVYRAAGILGVNLDYAMTRHWGARLAYRAQIFKGPDFRYTDGPVPVTASVTVSNEPSLGITYTFGNR